MNALQCTEGPPDDLVDDSLPLATIDKQEESDLDMDDVITEAPTSPQNHSPSITPPPHDEQMDEQVNVPNKRTHEKEKDKEQVKSLKIKRTSDSSSYRVITHDKEKRGVKTRPKTPMNFKKDPSPTPTNERNSRAKRPHSKELNASLNDDHHSKRAAPISKRRSTMASHCHVSDASSRSVSRKRRLSCSAKNADNTEDDKIQLRTRNSIGSGGGNDTNSTTTSKRMRLEQTPVKSDATAVQSLSTTPKRSDTIKSSQVNSKSLSSNFVAASAVDPSATAMVTIPTPRTNKTAHRREKSKETTPRITQFFAQQKTSTPVQASNTNTNTDTTTNSTSTSISVRASTPPPPSKSASVPTPAASAPISLMCDTCSIILSSVNELNFHKKSHSLKYCVKCKKPIDNAENPISAHTVSCFLLDNKLSNDLLTRFLKVKVDLDRLTPIKIKQIQKNLQQSNQSQNLNNDANANSSANVVSSMQHENNIDNRRQSKENTRRGSTPTTNENVQNSINDKSVDGKNDQGMFYL